MEFLTGYIIELSLSVDNVFLFAVIFSYFRVPAAYQHRVLFWGILSAVILRGLMIVGGAALIRQFHWIIYLFGAFLIYTGIRMYRHRNEETDIEQSRVVRLLRRYMPFSDKYDGQKFITQVNGRWVATPLMLVLAMVELTDVLFALDSIPAIFGITTDPFIVFTSNILAILGLRSLYFLLAGVMNLFHYLTAGLAVILSFVGTKMLLTAWNIHVPVGLSLGVIGGILAVTIIASLIRARREQAQPPAPSEDTDDVEALALEMDQSLR
jgi:tellurite resistance protein TerC